MIKNLNQLTFQNFGSVLSERAQPVKNADKNSEVLQLSRGGFCNFPCLRPDPDQRRKRPGGALRESEWGDF